MGGTDILRGEIKGDTTFFHKEEFFLLVTSFWVLLRHRRHKNAQKSRKQAVWDHFELNLGTPGQTRRWRSGGTAEGL
jgi:hypothetical protein